MFWTGEEVLLLFSAQTRSISAALPREHVRTLENKHLTRVCIHRLALASSQPFPTAGLFIPSLEDRTILYCHHGRMTGEKSHQTTLRRASTEFLLSSFNVSFCTYVGATFDASNTNLTYQIPAPPTVAASTPPLEVVISFLSPITPTSTLRQSIPASYITVHVSGGFDVDVYVDINGQWASGDRASNIVWELSQQELGDDKGLKTWKIRRETEQLLSEWRDQAEWGTLHFSAPSVGLTSQSILQGLTIARTFAMSLEHPACFALVSLGLVPFKMPSMMNIEGSWTRNPFSRSPSHSALMPRRLRRVPAVIASCSQ